MGQIPAEWQLPSDIMMTWPHEGTDWSYMLEEVRACYVRMIEAFTSCGLRVILLVEDELPPQLSHLPSSLVVSVKVPTNDTWTRDYGPIAQYDNSGSLCLTKYQFNGWGLKFAADRDNEAFPGMMERGIIKSKVLIHGDFVLEGGGIESDGCGTILTTERCQWSFNRNGGKYNPRLMEELKEHLGAERILILKNGYLAGDDTDSHIDTLARFADKDKIVYVGCDDPEDEHFRALQAMENELKTFTTTTGLPYQLFKLPIPDAIYDEDGNRLPATYANFLVTGTHVFMPSYSQPIKDAQAAATLAEAFSGHTVQSIDCRALIKQHGSLHCATMQIPKIAIDL